MLESILITKTRGSRGGVICDVHKRADYYVYFQNQHKRQCIVIGMVEKHEIICLEQLVGRVLKSREGVWKNNEDL
jgi:hypothetical protein